MTRLFTGDFATRDFSQYMRVINRFADSTRGRDYPASGLYPAQIVRGEDGIYGARFEVRRGDVPARYPTGERSQLQTNEDSFAPTAATRWYAFSFRLDPSFPINQGELGWCVLWGNKAYPHGRGNSALAIGWPDPSNPGFERSGYWYLYHVQQESPGVQVGTVTPLIRFPMRLGEWHRVILQINFQPNETGWAKMWWNDAPQTFPPESLTFTGQTLSPSGEKGDEVTGSFSVLGLYRKAGVSPPGIVDFRNFRMSDSPASL